MEMMNTPNAIPLIFSPTMERKFLSICYREGLVDLDIEYWNRYKDLYQDETVTDEEASYIFSNVFLHPNVVLKGGYEAPLSVKTDLIHIEDCPTLDHSAKCADIPLLLSYISVSDPCLNASEIFQLTEDLVDSHNLVIDVWGEMPLERSDGNIILMKHMFNGIFDQPDPIYSEYHLAAYRRYKVAEAKSSTIIRSYKDLNSIWARKNVGGAIALHPALQKGYREVLSKQDFEAGVTETDVLFLLVGALKTLPVGRTLKETLELSSSREGMALRLRILELYHEIQTGGRAAIPRVPTQIEQDTNDYRSLTSRLISPHLLSEGTDIALDVASLIPIVGIFFGGVGITKSSFATWKNWDANQKLKSMLWAQFQGRSL